LLFVESADGLGAQVAQQLERLGQRVITVSAGAHLAQLDENHWTINRKTRRLRVAAGEQIARQNFALVERHCRAPSFEAAQERGFLSLLCLAQALAIKTWRRPCSSSW